MPSIELSRRAILDEIGANPDLTLIRSEGNLGDELIWAGTRCLLKERVHREIGIEELSSASGELAVIIGSGAWGRVYNQFMPELLAIAEMRFSRVIVFPSTFEVAEDRVREALLGSHATFFAREQESYRQISGLCRARLALDGAFFFDYSDYRAVEGAGHLNAFRTDEERLGLLPIPSDNQDISITADSLEDWLETISRFAVVNTDRAHVMIAAALMGKQVNYAPSCYFKVDALAQSLIDAYDVKRYSPPSNGHVDPVALGGALLTSGAEPREQALARVSLVITGRDSFQHLEESIAIGGSSDTPTRVIVHDRNSRPRTRRLLERLATSTGAPEVRFADRDPGLADTLRLIAEETETEYLIALGYDMRLDEGALDRMVAVLDEHPTIQAVTPAFVDGEGIVQHAGGWPKSDSRSVSIEFSACNSEIAALEGLPVTTGWVPILGTLFRRSALDRVPFAELDDVFLQSIDWCMRAAVLGPDVLRVCPDAAVVAERPTWTDTLPLFVSRRYAASELAAHASFLSRHDRVVADRLSQLVPELRDPSGELDYAAANLLLELVAARGPEWTLMQWMNGGLDPLFAGALSGGSGNLLREREEHDWLALRHKTLVGIENGSWWKLRNRLQPVRRFTNYVSGRGKSESEEAE